MERRGLDGGVPGTPPGGQSLELVGIGRHTVETHLLHSLDIQGAPIAAYYAYLPRLPSPSLDNSTAPRIVANGDPMRGIAPCGACHGELDNKRGSPRIAGQPAAYILNQLQAFASGERRNDINQQMRTIARRMTPAEMEAAARYYSGESR